MMAQVSHVAQDYVNSSYDKCHMKDMTFVIVREGESGIQWFQDRTQGAFKMATDFYGPIAGIRRNEGSVCQTVTTELVYERKGADIFHPLQQARTEFAVEVRFQSGGGSSVEVMPMAQVDNLIAQLQALKERSISNSLNDDVIGAFEANNKAYELMLVTRAAADKRAEVQQLIADLSTMEHGEMPSGKKVSARKLLDAIKRTANELNEAKAELDKLEAAVAARSE